MEEFHWAIGLHLVSALVAGAVIGLERTYHGRPAGFRTHTLVCLASSLLMLLTLYQEHWFGGGAGAVMLDPTRTAQGIMTGIGFLGAGVIIKEGASVRGLTTAASIWITAAIGILLGAGFYFPAFLSVALALGTLSIFRAVESRIPGHSYAFHHISFDRGNVMPEEALRTLLREQGFTISGMSYRLTDGGKTFEYRMVIRTNRIDNASELSFVLSRMEQVREFRILPIAS